MLRRALSLLGILQIATLASVVMVVVSLAVVLWHQTDDYFMPLPNYLSSIKIALPPLAIFLASYVIAFVTGTALADTSKLAIAFCRNRLLQSASGMSAVVVASLIIATSCAVYVNETTPPAYARLLSALLGASSDESQLVKNEIDAIRKSNPALAAQLTKVVEVFAERSAVNAGKKQVQSERAKVLVRSLESFDTAEWQQHPLRKIGAAEAYVLYGQSIEQAGQGFASPDSADAAYQRATALLGEVRDANSSLVPGLLKASATNNLGNAFYYMKQNERALASWRQANSPAFGRTNLSSWSNIVAALILLDRPVEAIQEGERAKDWAATSGRALIEPYQYAGLVGNLAFAKWEVGDTVGALADLATAHAFQEDDLTRQNLALGLIVQKRHDDAQRLMRHIAPPASRTDNGTDKKVARCVYLIWGLAMPTGALADPVANFSAFLGEARSQTELELFDEVQLGKLVERAANGLPNAAYPCGSLAKIKVIRELLVVNP